MKKIIIILVVLMGLITSACYYEEEKIEIGNIYDYDFPNEIPNFDTIPECIRYIKNNLIYKIDISVWCKEDYWQTPEETDHLKTGDCEDYVIYSQYIIETRINILTYMAIIIYPSGEEHSLLYTDGYYYDLVNESDLIIPLPSLRDDIIIKYIIPYSEVLWMTINYHDNVGKYE